MLPPVDPELLKQALTHVSLSRDDGSVLDNERLEFLGDSVLKLVFSEYLYERFPACDEGILTKYRAKLISDSLLSQIASDLQLANYIKVGSTMTGKIPASVVGNALEAIIGAVYLDSGYGAARDFILKSWDNFIQSSLDLAIETEYKSRLQEVIQEKFKTVPEYKVLETSGPDHAKIFTMGVFLQGKKLAEATSFSKKEAGQQAAAKALENISEWL